MSFFTYYQNNSGGGFDVDTERGIASRVIIEASTAAEADARAESAGVYFDHEGLIDCQCCGSRWTPAYGAGDPVPTVYGTERAPGDADSDYAWTSPEGFIHYVDSRIEAFGVRK